MITNAKMEEFDHYIDLCNDEYGEYCSYLSSLWKIDDFLPSDFKKALETEIDFNLQNFKESSRIITKKVEHTLEELIWD